MSGWLLSDSLMSWFINTINSDVDDVFCMSFLEEFRGGKWNDELLRRFQRKFNSKKPTSIIIFPNVGRRAVSENPIRFKTYLGQDDGPNNENFVANHYTLLVIDIQEQTMQYCDSNGWEMPMALKTHVMNLFETLQLNIVDITIGQCHQGSNSEFQHKCIRGVCSTFYPLQDCGHVCGVSIIVYS